MNVTNFDCIIIGAGPAGLSAACAARDCGLEVALLDEQAAPGGQLFRNVESSLGQRLLDEKDRLKELTSDNNKLIERCRDELAQMMINEEVPKVSRSGYSYTLQEKTKYSKSAGADEELFSLLRAEGLGDLIKETVSPQTL